MRVPLRTVARPPVVPRDQRPQRRPSSSSGGLPEVHSQGWGGTSASPRTGSLSGRWHGCPLHAAHTASAAPPLPRTREFAGAEPGGTEIGASPRTGSLSGRRRDFPVHAPPTARTQGVHEVIVLSNSGDDDIGDGSGSQRPVDFTPRAAVGAAEQEHFAIGRLRLGGGGVVRDTGLQRLCATPSPASPMPKFCATVCLPHPRALPPPHWWKGLCASAWSSVVGVARAKVRSQVSVGLWVKERPQRDGRMREFGRDLPGPSPIPPPPSGYGDTWHTEEGPRRRSTGGRITGSSPMHNQGLPARLSPTSGGRPSPRLWAVSRLVEGGGRWSWRWRLAVAAERPSARAVEVGGGVTKSYE